MRLIRPLDVAALIAIVATLLLVTVTFSLKEDADDTPLDRAPILLTVSPTDSPHSDEAGLLSSLPVAGGLDALFTPTPGPEVRAPSPHVTPQGAPGWLIDLLSAPEYQWSVARAARIVSCETGRKYNADAINPTSGTRGLFQIHPIHAARFSNYWDEWMIPEANADMAYALWSEQWWNPWACSP